MNLQNIISAGRMMSIVLALLGAFRCGAAFALGGETMLWDIALGAALTVCGLALVIMIPRAESRRGMASLTLAVGVLLAFMGAGAVALEWPDPFSWMIAIVGVAIFVDTLCLYIKLGSGR